MNYSTTNSSGTSSVAPGVGHFLLFPAPHGWGICRFLHAIKTNPHLYPRVGWVRVYFDWCIIDSIRVSLLKIHFYICLQQVYGVFSLIYSWHLTMLGSCCCKQFNFTAEPLVCALWLHSDFDNIIYDNYHQ